MPTRQPPPKTASNESANRPVHDIRLGRLKAAIWANKTENGVRHNATFRRIYKDDAGQWRDSDSFGNFDLLLLAKLADQVHTWICAQAATENAQNSTEESAHF
jgi:hypothetical protein